MKYSRSFQVFKLVLKERYREPTLELVLPLMLVSNVFLSAFYERGDFNLLGVVLSFVPIIGVSETLAFALGLRNVVFVSGDHIHQGSIISFLMMSIRRETLFFFLYVSDVVLPLAFWILTTSTYSLLSGIPVPALLLLTYVGGYLFSLNLVLLLTIYLRTPGLVVLISFFSLGSVFVFGGAINYYELIEGNLSSLFFSSFSNPYVLWIAYSLGRNLISQIYVGVAVDLSLALIFLLMSFKAFRVIEL
ncbi:hypothetical protein [Metallosphaera sp.]